MMLLLGLLIPFLGTMIGSFLVFFMRDKLSSNKEKALLGIAAGVMIAASIWSLLIPSIEMVDMGAFSFFPATIGFSLGILFLFFVDLYTRRINMKNSKLSKMIFAITLHNIPEGMAVGAGFALALTSGGVGLFTSAFILSLGIAVQNIPEGAIISMPLKENGCSRKKSFFYGIMTGIVEPIFGVLTVLLMEVILPLLPYLLSFAAGAMIYVVVDELIPECRENNKLASIYVGVGFLIMMILDVCFG